MGLTEESVREAVNVTFDVLFERCSMPNWKQVALFFLTLIQLYSSTSKGFFQKKKNKKIRPDLKKNEKVIITISLHKYIPCGFN